MVAENANHPVNEIAIATIMTDLVESGIIAAIDTTNRMKRSQSG
jgi:hypothetical protein